MRSKKCFVMLAVAVCLAATLWGQESKDPNDNVKLLQEKIERLEKTIEFQQKKYEELKADYDDIKKQLDEQIQDNERLKALVKNTDIVTESVIGKFDPNNGIIYLGKQRDKLWFYRMYRLFCDKLAYVDGKYIYLPFVHDRPAGPVEDITQELKPEGTVINSPSETYPYDCTVIQVLSPDEAIIRRDRPVGFSVPAPEILFHLKGYIGKLVDNQPFSYKGHLVSAGVYEYIDTSGAKSTIQSFRVDKNEPLTKLTKEQFADAIKSGIKLITRREVNGKIIETPIQ
jgi:hypothetical protein